MNSRTDGWSEGLTYGRRDGRTDERKDEWTDGSIQPVHRKRRAMTVLNDAGSKICNASLDRLYETALVLEYVMPL